MANEQEPAVRRLYKKLIGLYPKAFRDSFGESMERTFDDLCNERRKQAGSGMLGFVLWMSADTATGVIKEHISQFTYRSTMNDTITNFRSAAIISFFLVLPFMILELVNRRNLPEGFPIALFGLMWILPVVFILILMPIVRNMRAGNDILANQAALWLRVVFLTLLALVWGYSLYDQLPCFLGVANCD